MKQAHINFREKDESDYGWEYLKPYLENNPNKPLYYVLEQIFREHELYKGIAENIITIQSSMDERLKKIEQDVHFSLLRTGDAEKNVRTMLHCWNSYFFISNTPESKYLGMGEIVTPIMEKAINETNSYYKDLAAKKRSKAEMTLPEKDEANPLEDNDAPQMMGNKEQPILKKNQENKDDEFDISSIFAD